MKKWDMEKRSKKGSNIFTQLIPPDSETGPCGPLKEFKKSAISPGLAPRGPLKATGNQQLATDNQQLTNATQFSD